MSIKVILFDFDDTLFLKKKREFIPRIINILQELKFRKIICIIVTCNHKAVEIIKQHGIDHFFTDIIHVNSRTEYKSEKIKRRILSNYQPSNMIFFDNDPLHVYDVSFHCDIRSFLVNPEYGLSEDLIFMFIDMSLPQLRQHCHRRLQDSNHHQLLDRYVSLQNLMELDKIK